MNPAAAHFLTSSIDQVCIHTDGAVVKRQLTIPQSGLCAVRSLPLGLVDSSLDMQTSGAVLSEARISIEAADPEEIHDLSEEVDDLRAKLESLKRLEATLHRQSQ